MKPTNRRIPLADLQPHPHNYNRHPAKQIKRIATSLRKFGQVRSIVVWRNTILAGHGVVEAARSMRWNEIAADVLPDEYPEHLALAYVAADNELGRMGDPDQAALAAIIEQSKSIDNELLEAIGYDESELAKLVRDSGLDSQNTEDTEPQIDRAEELRQKWGVESGQLWQLGNHLLICGDCTDATVVERVMSGEKAQACLTDPPYGTASPSKVQKRGNRLETFDIEWDTIAPISWIGVWSIYMQDGAALISFWDNAQITVLWDALIKNGLNPLQTVYWKKSTVPQPRQNFCSSIESGIFCRKPGRVLCWNGGGATPNVIESNRASGNERTVHETQKPLDLWCKLLKLITDPAMITVDPFSGSGTTLIACENLSRRCRAVEISPGYVAVTLERWATTTKKTPTIIG